MNHPSAYQGLKKISCWLFFMAGMSILLGSCLHLELQPRSHRAEELEAARQAFFKEDYSLARKKFNELKSHPESSGAGEYGLACIQMITAKDTGSFLAAFELLNRQPGSFPGQNPDLLIKSMGHGLDLLERAGRKKSAQMAGLKADKTQQTKKIQTLVLKIKKLEHQILALENIDQELQEKRKNQ